MTEAEVRLRAIAAASAAVLREVEYRTMRVEDVAAVVALPAGRGRPAPRRTGRSGMWLYGEVGAKRVLAALAAAHAWTEFRSRHSDDLAGTTVQTVHGAVHIASRSFADIARFHRTERFLMSQVRTGIGDLSPAAERRGVRGQPPGWATARSLGLVAREAWQGRCAAFAEFLTQRLNLAMSAAVPPPRDDAMGRHLSHLASQVCTDEGDESALPGVVRGLTSYWFGRYLRGYAGWAPAVEQAELRVDRMASAELTPRHRISAANELVMELLSTDVLLGRAVDVAANTTKAIAKLTSDVYPPGPERGDATRLLMEVECDLTSRLGFALHRLGRYAESAASLNDSLAVNDKELGGDPSRAARAWTNLATTQAAAGKIIQAIDYAERGLAVRQRLCGSDDNPTTRGRLSISEHVLVQTLAAAGHTSRAVQAVRTLLDERLRSGRGVTEARRDAGLVLREAGQPERARQQLRLAHDLDAPSYLPFSYTYQTVLLEMARCGLDLDEPANVVALLDGSPALDDWFADRVSPRLAVEVRLTHSQAVASLDPDGGLAALSRTEEAARARLGARHPTTFACTRAVAATLCRVGELARARQVLTTLRKSERAALDNAHPARIQTLLGLAAVHEAAGATGRAEASLQTAMSMAEHGIDPHHPLILAARCATARLKARLDHPDLARILLRPLLDRTAVFDVDADPPAAAWRLPALEDFHPLLIEARRLAGEVNIIRSLGDEPAAPPAGDMPE